MASGGEATPQFEAKLNQTSAEVSQTGTTAAELQIIWNDSTQTPRPLEITIGNMTNTATYERTENMNYSVQRISDTISDQTYEITFNITSDVQPGEYAISILVKDNESGYARNMIFKLRVE